ncbi:MAG: DUF87 domain-containing protein [Calditrichaeota bacterium]|nr:MAG: DUF87 domain-containing protein [Calditrichota bacterium]
MSSKFSRFIYYTFFERHDKENRELMCGLFPSLYSEVIAKEKKEKEERAKYVNGIFNTECLEGPTKACLTVCDFGEQVNRGMYFLPTIYEKYGLFIDTSIPVISKEILEYTGPSPYDDRETITIGKMKLKDLQEEQYFELAKTFADKHNLMVKAFDGLLGLFYKEVEKAKKRLLEIDFGKHSDQPFVKKGKFPHRLNEVFGKHPVNGWMHLLFTDKSKDGKDYHITCDPKTIESHPRKVELPEKETYRNDKEFKKQFMDVAHDAMVRRHWYFSDFYLHLSYKAREKHTYILGGSGSGKTELLKILINEDVEKFKSVFVLDPHGDFAKQVAHFSVFNTDIENLIKDYELRIKERIQKKETTKTAKELYDINIAPLKEIISKTGVTNTKDLLVYISPEYSDNDLYACYNPLEHDYNSLPETQRRNKLSFKIGQLVSAFEVIFGSDFTHNMYLLVFNCLRLLMEKEDSNLLDLLEMMQPEKAQPHLKDVSHHWDKELVDYFENIYPGERLNTTKSAVYTRFAQAFTNQILKTMLTQRKSTFNPMELLDQRRSVIVNLSQGYFTEVGTKILGSFLTAALTTHGLNRSTISGSKRVPIYAYIDECQNFLNSNIDKTLEELRKFKIHLTLANQYLGQFRSEPKLKDSILANTGIKFCGKASFEDQNKLSKYIGMDISSLPQLKTGEFVVKPHPNKEPVLFKAYSHLVESIDKKEKRGNYMKNYVWSEVEEEQLKKYYVKILPSTPSKKKSNQTSTISSFKPPKPDELL